MSLLTRIRKALARTHKPAAPAITSRDAHHQAALARAHRDGWMGLAQYASHRRDPETASKAVHLARAHHHCVVQCLKLARQLEGVRS